MLSASSSRKTSRDVSAQELFYITRSLFHRNKQFVRRMTSIDVSSIPTQQQQYDGQQQPSTRQKVQPPPLNLRKQNMSMEMEKTNRSFEKFFQTSAGKIDEQLENEFIKSRRRFYFNNNTQHNNNNDELNFWKVVHPQSPRHGFEKLVERPNIFQKLQKDDERRYNNFSLLTTDPDHTIDIGKLSQRRNNVLNCTINDLQYDEANQIYVKNVINNTVGKCLFKYGKESYNPAIKNKFQTPLMLQDNIDIFKVQKAKLYFSPYKRNSIPKMDKQIGRERPNSNAFRILKSNENPYIHQLNMRNITRYKKRNI